MRKIKPKTTTLYIHEQNSITISTQSNYNVQKSNFFLDYKGQLLKINSHPIYTKLLTLEGIIEPKKTNYTLQEIKPKLILEETNSSKKNYKNLT